MKKLISLFLILCMLVIGSTSVFANSGYNYDYSLYGDVFNYVQDYYDNGTHYVITDLDFYTFESSYRYSNLDFYEDVYVIDANGNYTVIGGYTYTENSISNYGAEYSYDGVYEIPSTLNLEGAKLYVQDHLEMNVLFPYYSGDWASYNIVVEYDL